MLHSNVTERNIAKIYCEKSKLSTTMSKCCNIFFLVRLESVCRRPPTIRECASRHYELCYCREQLMKISWELCYCRDYIVNEVHLMKAGPMHMKIFISRLCIVVNIALFLRESVIVPIFWREYKVFQSYVFVPQHAFIMILRFYVVDYDVLKLCVLFYQLIKQSTVMSCVGCLLGLRSHGCVTVDFSYAYLVDAWLPCCHRTSSGRPWRYIQEKSLCWQLRRRTILARLIACCSFCW